MFNHHSNLERNSLVAASGKFLVEPFAQSVQGSEADHRPTALDPAARHDEPD